MEYFYNRDPWNLIIGFGMIIGLLVMWAAFVSWWLLVAPLVLIIIIYARNKIRRISALNRLGYHCRIIGVGKLLYEERHGSSMRSFTLTLAHTEPGHYELFVPINSEWSVLVPDWARMRRLEIAERIANSWRREDVHIT